jgi:UDP-N-acetylglucosamine/UDP-N-acetylgalactosamine diphosphorylase
VTRTDKALRAAFCEADQGHVFRFFDELPSDEQATLLGQLRAIDLKRVRRLIEQHLAADDAEKSPALAPAPIVAVPSTEAERREEAKSRKAGEEALREARVAVLIVAGGQATRLGYDAPKGTFPIGPVSGKSLFQIHAEKVLALGRRYGKPVPLLLLVSPDNHATTRAYFEQHSFFGLDPKLVRFFEQGMLPALDRDGRLLLAERGRIFLSPDGHGGVFRALQASGCLDFLAKRGVDTVFYFQVDNPLVKVADPVFLGHHLRRESEFSLKVVAKRDAAEKVGVYAQIDGRPGIVEYSDLPAAQRDMKGADGRLLFGAGSIAIHAFSLPFLRRLGRGDVELALHVARKNIPYVGERGEVVHPGEANGIKFESFVFDGLSIAKTVLAMEVERNEEFAPVKNKSGEDSAETAIQAQSDLFRSWLADAGMKVEDPAARIEIGPLFALDRGELAARFRGSGVLPARRILID